MRQSVVGSLVVMIVLSVSGVTMALDNGVDINLTTDFYSKYVWRGMIVTDDWVFQPDVNLSYKGFTAGVWGSLDMTNENGQDWEFIEYDYYADYSFSLPDVDWVSFSVGYIYYEFPSVGGDTYEFYGGASFDTILNPSVTCYYDADEVNGYYIAFGIGHSFDEIGKLAEDIPVGMEFGANIGWADTDYNEFYWGETECGMNDLTLSLAFPFEIGSISVSPSVNYMTLLDSDIRSGVSDGDKDAFFTGISLSTSF